MLKLEAYCLSEKKLKLLKSYLENTRIYIEYYTNPWKTEEPDLNAESRGLK
jgi:hypothetical protein